MPFSRRFWAFFSLLFDRDIFDNSAREVLFMGLGDFLRNGLVSEQRKEADNLLETAKQRAFGTGTGDGGNAHDTLKLADLFNL
jgi:hypothetical protein